MQTKQDLEEFYKTPDPWGYRATADDWYRRSIITNLLKVFVYPSERMLDIGAGEGFITNSLENTEQLELSDRAAKMLRNRVKKPTGHYRVILAAGVLYDQYDYKKMREWVENHAEGIVLTCHYDRAGVAHDLFDKPQIFYAEFPYREGKQILRVYRWQ